MRYCLQILLMVSCVFLNVASAESQTSPFSLELAAPLPVDPSIQTGQFGNGITYFIKVNKKPENRAELRLAVNAGSVLEDADQLGLAHFAEHMAFNGTKNFAKHELIDYLESIGMKFGPEINAYTSFDETVYMLQVPTDSLPVMEKALQILQDWAQNISFEDVEIDKERGVIIEEWRLGRGATARMRDKQFPIIFKNSIYAERLPIGKKDVLESFPYDAVKRFYRDWYRPDLMAVIAVGDFDPALMKKNLEKYFAALPVASQERPRTLFPVPDHPETLFAIATDPEATATSVSVYYKMNVDPVKTVADYRHTIVEGLYNSMLNRRLDELTRKPDPPFMAASSNKGRFVRSKDVYALSARVKDGGIPRGLESLLTEARRVKKFGFTQTELDRTKAEMLRQVEQAYKERDKSMSASFASEYIRVFLEDEPVSGIEYEFEFYKKFLPEVQLAEVNALAAQWISDSNRVITVNAPEKPGVTVPTESELLTEFETVDHNDIQPWVDKVSDQPLVPVLPTPGRINKTKEMKELGVTEWVLSNGVRVVLKPTDFKNDEIVFTSYSPGGNSLVADKDFIAALTSTNIVEEGGVGTFTNIELEKKLAGKVVSVSPYIQNDYEGISGSASPQDCESLFQLIYLYFTAPRKDNDAFLSYQTRMKGWLENRTARPDAAFSDTIQVVMAQHNFRARPMSVKILEEMDLDRSLQIYRDRFADASDFVFFFVGNLDPEKLKPFIVTYLGGLPATFRHENYKDLNIHAPKGVLDKQIHKGIEPKSLVQIMFTGPYEWNRQNNYDMESMVSALRIRLREEIREEKSGTYGVRVSAIRSYKPDLDYQITISFGTAPERVDELTSVIFSQIDSLAHFGPKEIYITKVKETQLREYEVGLRDNDFWVNNLSSLYQYDMDPNYILTYKEMAGQLSAQAIQKAAQKYLDRKNYVRVVLYPEGDPVESK
jgi:zinc protease